MQQPRYVPWSESVWRRFFGKEDVSDEEWQAFWKKAQERVENPRRLDGSLIPLLHLDKGKGDAGEERFFHVFKKNARELATLDLGRPAGNSKGRHEIQN